MVPGNARPRHPIVEERTRRLTAYAETTDLNREELGEDTSLGIITSSTCYQYAQEVFGEKASILKLGLVNPLPGQTDPGLCRQGGPPAGGGGAGPRHREATAGSLGLTVSRARTPCPCSGEFSQSLVAEKLVARRPIALASPWTRRCPPRPPVLCAGCPHRGLFYTLAKHKVTVLGDIGCYTLAAYEPLYAIETCELHGGLGKFHPRLQQGPGPGERGENRGGAWGTPPSCTPA